VAWLIERLVLGKLVNQEGITLLMATLGITYFLDGFGQTLFGSDIYKIDIGLPKDPMFLLEKVFQGGVLVNKEDLYAAVHRRRAGGVLALFFQYTSTGRALRAVADDHQAAQSIGIPLAHLGHRLERGRLRRAGGRHHLGQQAGRAVLAVAWWR
jgi:branched-chain amino acid transport system permease protein